MANHKDLDVWKLSMDLVVDIYKMTDSFPEEEKFGVISQLRRAAVSVPTNIAEGAARNSNKENLRFLFISLGSLSEIETLLIISKRLNFIDNEDVINNLFEIKAKLVNLIKYVKKLV